MGSGQNQNTTIEVSYQDFLDHFSVGKTRTILNLQEPVMMDIKDIDDTGTETQTWVMPNFNNYTNTKIESENIGINVANLRDSFPNPTHAFLSDENIEDIYQLNEDELFFYGYGFNDENGALIEKYDYYVAQAPIPLKWGLDYTGEVTFVYEADPQIDSTLFVQHYDVIAQGTLKTFDDGDVDAVKAIFVEIENSYKNGVLFEKDSIEQIVWYSKKGHYLRGDLKDPWNKMGNVELKNMSYQKINTNTASTNDESLQAIKMFPNPIAPGKILTIESKKDLTSFSVVMYNITGQKINTLRFNKANNTLNQIKIPENLSSGIYFYKVVDKQGVTFKNGKIQVK